MWQKKNKILFIGVPFSDYLADSFLIGLKSQPEFEVIEWIPNMIVYRSEDSLKNSHGMGFTIGKVLYRSLQKIYNNSMSLEHFGLFIFGSIKHQLKEFLHLRSNLRPDNTILLDGGDSASLYPFNRHFLVMSEIYRLPLLYRKFPYFKREWIPEESFFPKANRFIPSFISNILFNSKYIRPISFSIPEEKILETFPEKTKLFPKHIVDEEVASKIDGSFTKYAFDNETAYYKDLQTSKFGITTKRAGWDCMRHYEIAANGAVICFKDLNKKPISCAPHGLVDGHNCISYTNFHELMTKVRTLNEQDYSILQGESLNWIKNKTCKVLATNIINEFI